VAHTNLGQYRACYIDALRSKPNLQGRVMVHGVIDGGGAIISSSLARTTVRHKALERCLRRAVSELWFLPFPGETIIRFSFLLRPSVEPSRPPLQRGTVQMIESNAAALLEQGNGEAAFAAYSSLIQQAPLHPNACQWHVGALEARLSAAPWIDERTEHAAEALARYLAGHSSPLDQTCRERALAQLREFTERPLRQARLIEVDVSEVTIARYEWLLVAVAPLALEVDVAEPLREARSRLHLVRF
jgi:hypothetical protein